MFERYAVFYCPTGPLAQFGAAWLGWDNATGRKVSHPEMAPLDVAALTKTPQKYGLHGTLKAPFNLIEGSTLEDVKQKAALTAARLAPLNIGPLSLRHKNGFIGLRPEGPQFALRAFAADLVRSFDPLRAPLSADDIARRRKSRLTAQQDARMLEWGYPYIFEDFHFHLTLTGRVKPELGTQVITTLTPHVIPRLTDPFMIEAITIVGQDSQGMFHQIQRYALTG